MDAAQYPCEECRNGHGTSFEPGREQSSPRQIFFRICERVAITRMEDEANRAALDNGPLRVLNVLAASEGAIQQETRRRAGLDPSTNVSMIDQ